jgi:hypothetical protein
MNIASALKETDLLIHEDGFVPVGKHRPAFSNSRGQPNTKESNGGYDWVSKGSFVTEYNGSIPDPIQNR